MQPSALDDLPQTVLDLQAIAWPDRLRALTLVLQGVADGRPLAEMRAEAAEIAATALLHLILQIAEFTEVHQLPMKHHLRAQALSP